ncbi:MAG: hypothetical protein JJU36_14430 [Phycisphaeraceae bacterium]|nr:hypothetical protein [Phycisphaeraceae bacterium]
MRKINPVNLAAMLRDGRLAVPPLAIRVLTFPPDPGATALLEVSFRGRSCRYVAWIKRDAKPMTLRLAIDQVKQSEGESDRGQPMIIAPYFSREKLDQLLDARISAIDFSGNAAIEIPGSLLFYKTGNPNQYPDSSPIRSAYRGNGSLVARMLLLERRFEAVSDIRSGIESRGGSLTMGMVSKVLQRLEADLAIERPNRNAVMVIQPERLLDGLLAEYQPPKIMDTWLGKVALSTSRLEARLRAIGRDGGLVRTGEDSATDYATWAGESIMSYYCRAAPTAVLERIGAQAQETRAFANLRLMQSEDQRVYFDPRSRLAASPIQAWLEMASGDKRQKQIAGHIRNAILGATGAAG